MKNLPTKQSIFVLTLIFGLSSVAQVDNSANTVTLRNSKLALESAQTQVNPGEKMLSKEKMGLDQRLGKKLEVKTLRTDVRNLLEGGIHGGGGDGVIDSSGRARLLDLIESGDLEYLNPNRILWEESTRLAYKIKEEGILREYSKGGFQNPLNESLFSFYIQKSLNIPGAFEFSEDEFIKKPIEMKFYFSDTPLNELNDEGRMYIGEEYNKVQLAIQNANGQVVIFKPLFEKLSPKDKSALLLHEALLRVVWQYNPEHLEKFGTEYIRKLNRLIFKRIEGEFIPQDEMVEAVKTLGIKTLDKYF